MYRTIHKGKQFLYTKVFCLLGLIDPDFRKVVHPHLCRDPFQNHHEGIRVSQ